MSFLDDNRAYERWLNTQCKVVKADLDDKHELMTKSPFAFLRATCFRWARRIGAICPELGNAPAVLSVGDLHIENFGTWRDAEGRLVWGVNDFDEAARTPYPYDLVRLATSARLAAGDTFKGKRIAEAILEGYARGLREPRPTLLDEQETWMRPFVACSDKDREKFWAEVDKYPKAAPPKSARAELRASLLKGAKLLSYASRRKGAGSLGRPRFVAIAAWRGGRIVREAKALVPSAWVWASGRGPTQRRFLDLANGAHRAPDPFLRYGEGFVSRRIAADARKVDLGDEQVVSDELLTAMGFDLGALHAADRRRKAVRDHLRRRSRGWLHDAAGRAAQAVERDYGEWCEFLKGR